MKNLLGHTIPSLIWAPIDTGAMGGVEARAYQHLLSGLRVIETIEAHNDGREWYHVSFSFADRLPTYDDLQLVRTTFVGEHVTSLQIFPPKEQYVNIHPFCLHLYHCLTEEVVPDLSAPARPSSRATKASLR